MSRSTAIVLAGAIIFFLILAVLLTLEGHYTGRATTGTLVNISNSTPADCAVTLSPGLNTIGIPCIPTAVPVTGILNGTEYWAAYQYLPGESDPWRVHNPNLPSYVISDLQHLSRRAGYVVIMNSSKSAQISGFRVASTSVPLIPGWNLVGYPSIITRNASDSFNAIDNLTVARTYNTTLQAYLVYLNPGGGTLLYTIPGEGYWINATQSTTWSVTS